MAELMKRQFDLLAFTVSLDLSASSMTVVCLLEGSEEGAVNTLRHWWCTADELGLPATLDPKRTRGHGYPFHVPQRILDECNAVLREEFDLGEALWLHLREPTGYLDMIPWEQLMQPTLNVPMLRLPEFVVDPPRTSPSLFNIVLCSSSPAAKEAFPALDNLLGIARHLLATLPTHTMIDIFTDRAIYPQLQHAVNEDNLLRSRLRLHDPQAASPYTLPDPTSRVRDPMGRIESPWLLWMRDVLQGRSVDVVHFVTHGYYFQEQGALALAASPLENSDQYLSRFVGATELSIFLTQVGAWSVGFSSPAGNYSEMGLRRLAHKIAQMRPGPVLYHDLPDDENYAALAQTYGFLFGEDPIPPASPAVFTYCHPARLQKQSDLNKGLEAESLSGELLGATGLATRGLTRSAQPAPDSVQSIRENAAFSTIYTSNASAPGWVAAAERYVEQRTLELSKRSTQAEYIESDAEIEASLETLRQIQDIVAKNAQALTGTE